MKCIELDVKIYSFSHSFRPLICAVWGAPTPGAAMFITGGQRSTTPY